MHYFQFYYHAEIGFSGILFEEYSVNDIISLGGTAVGMSTAPELMKAQELKLNVIGISCLTNYGSGLKDETLTHEAVLETSSKIQNKFSEFMKKII